jgi:hypothetical protein
MHQDSQNFSNIMAIDPAKQLAVELEIATHGEVVYQILLNNELVRYTKTSKTLNLFDDIELKVNILENKNNGAVEIKKLTVNKKEILPIYQHLASKNDCWIKEGEWIYYIPAPFYSWYHNASGQGWIA